MTVQTNRGIKKSVLINKKVRTDYRYTSEAEYELQENGHCKYTELDRYKACQGEIYESKI